MECQSCYNPINSLIHSNKCITVMMDQIKESIISAEFKPMMTFGLGGCTAILMVFFTKDTNIPYKVVLGHSPDKIQILHWFEQYYHNDYNIVSVIKTPGEWTQIDGKYELKVEYEKYFDFNCKLIFEPYKKLIDLSDIFNSSLYFKMDPIPKYSDRYGGYHDITMLV